MARIASSKDEIADRSDKLTPDSLVRYHAAAVLALCLAHTPSVHDAQDVMQDVFVKAFTKIDTLREPAKARSWLLQIAHARKGGGPKFAHPRHRQLVWGPGSSGQTDRRDGTMV